MNKYQILQKIGEGQYGQVLKARNKQTNQIVAIKKFKDDENDEETKKVILREVKVLKMMKQQNITDFKEAFRKKGKVYLVCEFVEHNLLYLIDETKGIDKERIREYMFQILKGLAYMHSLDLIHRDIKPENILINSDGSLKICDFGFTRLLPAASGDMTQYVATRWYRPPELLLGVSNYEQSVDVWAAGCLFGEMIDGNALFPGESQIDQLYLIQKTLGALAGDHEELLQKNPKFSGVKFQQTACNDSLERRYLGMIGKEGMDLMKKMLKMDPNERITAAEALKHPYFNKLKSRVSRSPLTSDYYERPKLLTTSNNPHTRQRGHISMLGINKIKGVKQPQQGYSNPKYKLVINVQNMQNKQNNSSLPKNQKVLMQSRKQPLQLKKKTPAKDTYTQNYVQEFDDQEFPQAPTSKPKQIIRNKRKVDNYQQDTEQERILPKTPILGGKMKGKKKISKYDHDEDYDGPNLVFQKRREYEQHNNAYSIMFNNSNLNCY